MINTITKTLGALVAAAALALAPGCATSQIPLKKGFVTRSGVTPTFNHDDRYFDRFHRTSSYSDDPELSNYHPEVSEVRLVIEENTDENWTHCIERKVEVEYHDGTDAEFSDSACAELGQFNPKFDYLNDKLNFLGRKFMRDFNRKRPIWRPKTK